MKKLFFLLFLTMSCGSFSGLAAELADTHQHPTCNYCGMDRTKFAHSRMLIRYADGSEVGTCSLRCAAVDLATNLGKEPRQILVADYASKELIDAEKALWVLGGDQRGVMTMEAKWAFATSVAAQEFIAKHGGKQVDFEQAIKAAYAGLYQDTRMVRKMRAEKAMKSHQMGHQ